MAQTRHILLLAVSIFLVFFNGCNMNNYSKTVGQILEREKHNLDIETHKSNLLSHFPKSVAKDFIAFESNPPQCPPNDNCRSQFGDYCLIVPSTALNKDVSGLLADDINMFSYSDNNLIIGISAFSNNRFPVDKCNKWHPAKLPIPYFERYNFGLGFEETKKDINGDVFYNYSYTVPSDLMVYVIQAEAGDFWKENYHEKRPESLKEWKHGYSRGIATSEKENIIVYWTMVW